MTIIKVIGSVVNVLGWFWMATAANLGRKAASMPDKSNWAGRIIVYTCLFAGTIIFMRYIFLNTLPNR